VTRKTYHFPGLWVYTNLPKTCVAIQCHENAGALY
jgi:hypothetical protein